MIKDLETIELTFELTTHLEYIPDNHEVRLKFEGGQIAAHILYPHANETDLGLIKDVYDDGILVGWLRSVYDDALERWPKTYAFDELGYMEVMGRDGEWTANLARVGSSSASRYLGIFESGYAEGVRQWLDGKR